MKSKKEGPGSREVSRQAKVAIAIKHTSLTQAKQKKNDN